jgi:penicillin-binding protein 2
MDESKSFESLPIRTRLTDEEVARLRRSASGSRASRSRHGCSATTPSASLASHVIGYIGRINQAEKKSMEDWSDEDQSNYRGTEYIGKLGVEQSLRSSFTASPALSGGNLGRGARGAQAGQHPATPGNTVMLSIDIKLQRADRRHVWRAPRCTGGAGPAQVGEVLAFVSKPTFDPNLFVEGIDIENWQMLNESIDKPLLNRALRGTYHPGSTYKPFMALAALQTGKRSASTIVNDAASWTFGGHVFRSHGDRAWGQWTCTAPSSVEQCVLLLAGQ